MFRTRKKLADTLHKGFVTSCMAVTVIGLGFLAFRVGDYLLNVRPLQEARKLQAKKELLEEGRAKDELPDIAQTLRT